MKNSQVQYRKKRNNLGEIIVFHKITNLYFLFDKNYEVNSEEK